MLYEYFKTKLFNNGNHINKAYIAKSPTSHPIGLSLAYIDFDYISTLKEVTTFDKFKVVKEGKHFKFYYNKHLILDWYVSKTEYGSANFITTYLVFEKLNMDVYQCVELLKIYYFKLYK